jgi:hypothetical protein
MPRVAPSTYVSRRRPERLPPPRSRHPSDGTAREGCADLAAPDWVAFDLPYRRSIARVASHAVQTGATMKMSTASVTTHQWPCG